MIGQRIISFADLKDSENRDQVYFLGMTSRRDLGAKGSGVRLGILRFGVIPKKVGLGSN